MSCFGCSSPALEPSPDKSGRVRSGFAAAAPSCLGKKARSSWGGRSGCETWGSLKQLWSLGGRSDVLEGLEVHSNFSWQFSFCFLPFTGPFSLVAITVQGLRFVREDEREDPSFDWCCAGVGRLDWQGLSLGDRANTFAMPSLLWPVM